MTRAFVAFGANVGDPAETFSRVGIALRELPFVRDEIASRLYRTVPVGGPPGQEVFLNGCFELVLADGVEPDVLFGELAKIELRFGRVRGQRWDARPIDLDLVLFGDRRVETSSLLIPHPRMHYRAFVLAPLAELHPEALHPLLNQTARELWERSSRQAGDVLLLGGDEAFLSYARSVFSKARPDWRVLIRPESSGPTKFAKIGEQVVGALWRAEDWRKLNIDSGGAWVVLAGAPSENPGMSRGDVGVNDSDLCVPCFDARATSKEAQAEGVARFADSLACLLLSSRFEMPGKESR